MFCPHTGETLLEVAKDNNHPSILYLVLPNSKEKIAILEKQFIKRKNVEQIEVKLFDEYEAKVCDTVAIIESFDDYYY